MTLTPETADIAGLVERHRHQINGTGPWQTAGPDETLQEFVRGLQSLSAELAEAKGEIDRLRDLLRDRPNTILIAHEDGKQMRATRALAAAETKLAAMREALEPSGDTKAAYMGEFKISLHRTDEAGDEYTEDVTVPWTTIKEIMAAIKARALGGSNAE